jgi:hypothetical protein
VTQASFAHSLYFVCLFVWFVAFKGAPLCPWTFALRSFMCLLVDRDRLWERVVCNPELWRGILCFLDDHLVIVRIAIASPYWCHHLLGLEVHETRLAYAAFREIEAENNLERDEIDSGWLDEVPSEPDIVSPPSWYGDSD